jgi:AraC-like DNA-binding protein
MPSTLAHETNDDPTVAATAGGRTARAYGELSSTMKDHLYRLETGLIFTSPWVVTEVTVRRTATILLTANRVAFDVGMADSTQSYRAVAIKPLIRRGLHAANVKLVSVNIGPLHPSFRVFRAIPAPGALALDREVFAPFDSALEAAYRGQVTIDEMAALYEAIIATTVRHLPRVKPADARVERAIELLHENPNRPLDELADAIGLSYGRMSQLFAETVGISLRSYQLDQKIQKACLLLPTGRKLTDIAHACGFTDLAHLSRVFQQMSGAPLSYFMNKNYVEILRREDAPSTPPPPLEAKR